MRSVFVPQYAESFRSQFGPGADDWKNDCLPASVLTVALQQHIDMAGKHPEWTVDYVARMLPHPGGLTGILQGRFLGRRLGINLEHAVLNPADICNEIDARRPVIALIDYHFVEARGKYAKDYQGGHYLVVVGYATVDTPDGAWLGFYVNDPLHNQPANYVKVYEWELSHAPQQTNSFYRRRQCLVVR